MFPYIVILFELCQLLRKSEHISQKKNIFLQYLKNMYYLLKLIIFGILNNIYFYKISVAQSLW